MQNTSQKCPLISSLTPIFDSTNYLALFRSYQRAIIHCQTFSVARGERNAHFLVLVPRLSCNSTTLLSTDTLVFFPVVFHVSSFCFFIGDHRFSLSVWIRSFINTVKSFNPIALWLHISSLTSAVLPSSPG